MASMTQSPMPLTANLASKPTASDLLRSSRNGFCGTPLKSLGRAQLGAKRRDFTVTARRRRNYDYPWGKDVHNLDPDIQGGIFRHLSPFKPLKEKPKPVILEFEKPIHEMQKEILDVTEKMNETGDDLSFEIMILELKYQKALTELSKSLTPYQRVKIARHPHRPTFLDHVFNMTDSFVELHGDRAGYDDPAIVTGLGSIDGESYMFIGHQKGRNAKENIMRNFGMPTPHGYRKALRMMHYADHHGLPIITFIDTPGAYADLKSEELNQGEAIAQNLRTMFGLKVPIISIVIGEGGSGGALAIGCANKLLMLENSVFYVASPEACAAILYKTSGAAAKAAKKLKITATELMKIGVCDDIIPEPPGGAHNDPYWSSQKIKSVIVKTMNELSKMDLDTLLKHRSHKFRNIGAIDPKEINRKRNMRKKARGKLIVRESPEPDIDDEYKKLKQEILEASKSSEPLPEASMKQMIKKLERVIKFEYAEAAKYLGTHDKILRLRNAVAKARNTRNPKAPLFLKKNLAQLREDLHKRLPLAPNYPSLKSKIHMKTELTYLPRKLELNKIYSEFMDRPDVKERFEAINVEAEKLGVTDINSNPKLKEKMLKLKREVQLELKDVLASKGLKMIPTRDPDAEAKAKAAAKAEAAARAKAAARPKAAAKAKAAAKSKASEEKSNGSVSPDGNSNGSLVEEKKKKHFGLNFNPKDVFRGFF